MSDTANEHQTEFDEQGRPDPPGQGTEAETLIGFLEFQRATFAWKCAGLDSVGLNATIGPSPMALGGMMKHLAVVEDGWFTEYFAGEPLPLPWRDVDWEADRDWEWHTAATDEPEEIRALWQTAVERSRAVVAAALESGDMGSLPQASRQGRPPESRPTRSLRWILCHMVEEYARHNGHADLLRESIDGQTGE